MEEIWKDIKNYEGLYQVSNCGRVKHLQVSWICSRSHKITKKENIHHAMKKLNINYARYLEKMHYVNKKKVIRSDGKIYNQVKDIFEEHDVKVPNIIYDILKGRRKEYKGYSYKYLNEK